MSATGVVTTRPAAQAAPAQAAPPRPRRQPWLAVASLLVMVVAGGAFVLIHQRADARAEVLVVARPVVAGQVLVAQDLRVTRIVPAPGVDLVPASEASTVVGHAAAVPLVEGSLVSRRQLGPVAWPPEGQVVAAVPVRTGRLAEGVTAGSHVLVVEVEKESGAAQQTAAAAPVAGVVVSVRPGVEGSGTTIVSLLLDRQDAVSVAGTAAELSVAVARG